MARRLETVGGVGFGPDLIFMPNKPAQPVKPAPKQQPKKKPNGKKKGKRAVINNGATMAVMAVDARRLTHMPPPYPMGPYTVLRGRNTLTLTTNTSGQFTTMLIGPHRLTTIEACITPLVAIYGVGTNVPGTTETSVADVPISGYAGTVSSSTASAQLHAVTVVVQATSSATAANGQVYVGALSQRVGRTNYANFNSLSTALINRRELSPYSAYNSMTCPVEISAYPVDMIEWSTQCAVLSSSGTLSENYTADTLSQIAVVWPPTTTAVDYAVSIYTEWRVNFTDSVLNSTAIRHPPAPTSAWNNVISTLSTVNGNLKTLGQGVAHLTDIGQTASQIGTAFTAFRGVAARLGQVGAVGKYFL